MFLTILKWVAIIYFGVDVLLGLVLLIVLFIGLIREDSR